MQLMQLLVCALLLVLVAGVAQAYDVHEDLSSAMMGDDQRRYDEDVTIRTMSPACIPPNHSHPQHWQRHGNASSFSIPMGVSWCRYNNPFILSDFLSRNSTDLTVGGGDSTYEFAIKCGEHVPGTRHTQCEAIRQIRTATVGPMQNFTEMSRYVIYTDIEGHLLFVNFNNNTMAQQLRTEVKNITQVDAVAVQHVREEDNAPIQDVVMLAGNDSDIVLMSMRGDDTNDIVQCPIFRGSSQYFREKRMSLRFASFYPRHNNFTNPVYFTWTWRQDITYHSPTLGNLTARAYVVSSAPTSQPNIHGWIQACPGNTPMNEQMAVSLFYGGDDMKFDVLQNVVLNLTLFVAYTPRSLNLFNFNIDGKPNPALEKRFHERWFAKTIPSYYDSCADTYPIHNWDTNTTENSTRWRTAIFCPPNSETVITSVGMFSPDDWTMIGVFNRDVWLAIGLKNATHSYIHLMDLQELTFDGMMANSSLLNPLGLPDTFGTPKFPCNFETEVLYPDGSCRRRFFEQYTITSAADGRADADREITQLTIRAVQKNMNVPTNWPNFSNFNISNVTNGSIPSWLPPANWTNGTNTSRWEPTGNKSLPVPLVLDQHATLVAAHGSTLTVLSIFNSAMLPNSHYDPNGQTAPPVIMQHANDLHFLGDIRYVDLSDNAQHVFTAVRRSEWELGSQTRFKEICDNLTATPDDPFLQPYAAECDKYGAQPVNLNAFTQYASTCSFGTYCPTLDRTYVTMAESGYYAERPAVSKPCPAGAFCPLGQKVPCPPGFYCDTDGLSDPKPCPNSPDFNVTCANEGTITPQPCPEGAVCILTHMPGVGAPPGFATQRYPLPRNDFVECPAGQWCPLGRSVAKNESNMTALLCPADTYCDEPSALQPKVCACDGPGVSGGIRNCSHAERSKVFFCPSGTSAADYCTAGYHCSNPTTRSKCVPSQYCPPGTFAPQLCPAGSFCPTPAEKHECPSRHYCPSGSTVPTPCNLLTICSPGSSSQQHSMSTVLLVVILFIVIPVLVLLWERRLRVRSALLAEAASAQETAPSEVSSTRANMDPADEADDEHVVNGSGVWSSKSTEATMQTVDGTQSPDSQVTATALNMQQATAVGGDQSKRKPGGKATVPECCLTAPHIRFDDMGLQLRGNGKRVLEGVTGSIPQGTFVAVMGPSGGGKSTFMHTLAGKAFYGERLGRVTLNGSDVDIADIGKAVGFVKQDDIMHRDLTVAETLRFNARMRADPAASERLDPSAVAKDVMHVLELAHVKDTRIGDEKVRGISGGQRKRVNIGMELVARPALLFLDEPTSGLDSSSSMVVCKALREACNAKMSVIAVIHQPRYEIFEMFHRILFIARRVLYFGPPSNALRYFSEVLGVECPPHVNPPDFMMDVISGEFPPNGPKMSVDELADKWMEFGAPYSGVDDGSSGNAAPVAADGEARKTEPPTSEDVAAPLLDDDSRARTGELYEVPGDHYASCAHELGRPGVLRQVFFFLKRAMLQQWRNLTWVYVDFLLVLTAGFFLGLVFSRSQYRPPLPVPIVNKALSSFKDGAKPPMLVEFFDRPIDDPIISEASLSCMAIGMTGVTAALRVFGNEQIVYWRESSAGMSTLSYFLAKNVAHLGFIVLSPLLYVTPFLNFVNARGSFTQYYWVLLIVQFATTGLGYFISILAPPTLAQLVGVVVVLVFAMFGGARPTLVQINDMFAPLRAMPYMSYIRWGQEAMYLVEIREWAKVSGVNVQPSLDLFDYHLDDFTMCLGITFAFGIGFRIAAFIAMLVMHREQKL